MDECLKCQRALASDEVALHKKLMGKTSTEFMCLSCLAEYFEVEELLLREKIDQYKKMGCTLFG